jgi:hypothetical protein
MAVYPLNVAAKPAEAVEDDSVTFAITPIGAANGKIVAIRVQDIDRGLWFNWDDPPRAWDSLPSCTAGVNKLYVAFYVTNVGNLTANITARLVETGTGTVLAERTFSLAPGESNGVEWTGDMPAGEYQLTCSAVP